MERTIRRGYADLSERRRTTDPIWNMKEVHGVCIDMRALLATVMLFTACGGPRLVFRSNQQMSRDEQLKRASLVFVGVIQRHEFCVCPPFRFTKPSGDWWTIMRRTVSLETVLRGAEDRKEIDVYEIFWADGTSGDWNSTQNNERYLFLVQKENGYYHVVGDWWRSIYPVTTGTHSRLPLDDSHSLWERIALMNWWIERSDDSVDIGDPRYNDPGLALSLWRTVKLERGLVRHPSPSVRIHACRELLQLNWGQDECWDSLSEADRTHMKDGGYACCSDMNVTAIRNSNNERSATWYWDRYHNRDSRRLCTAISNKQIREDSCRLWERDYPDDHDNGCPADRPPPATIVTDKGDVPLIGAWPRR